MRARHTSYFAEYQADGDRDDTHTVMNRSAVKDSTLSLDELRFIGDHPTMSLYPYKLYCERMDHTRNMVRYYMLSIQPTMFGEAAVMRS
jgi:hypothetical protein